MALRIDTLPTVALHERLAGALPNQRDQFLASLSAANDSMHAQHMALGNNKPLEVALSALLLSADDEGCLRQFAETLHQIVEIALEVLVDDPALFARYFPEHQRILPFLAKSRGVDSWQVLSRYDLAVTRDGHLKILELNTACPGALLISQAVCQITRRGFGEIHPEWIDLSATRFGTVDPQHVTDALLEIEQAAGIEPGAIGVLNDENNLVFELDHLVHAIQRSNRHALKAGAHTLHLRDDRLFCNGEYLSLVYNKFRVSNAQSPNHCWRDGFQSRYASFLAAQQSGHVVSVNNLVGMTVGENKALLGALYEPAIHQRLTESQRRFIDENIPWTRRLEDAAADYCGDAIELLEFVREHRDQFVIKPANEGRGFGIAVGKYCTPSQWEEACKLTPEMPKVVQQYVDTVTFPVICAREGELKVEQMFLTLGLATIRGRYEGVISRISASPITNVAREGFGQAVFVQSNPR
ncbi:MAG: hypothetical protein VB876_19105 [Pirellulales bacterium]|jgi:hypothetical protein